MSLEEVIHFDYQIEFAKGNQLKPETLRFRQGPQKIATGYNHLKFLSDMLVGLNFTHLHDLSDSPSPTGELPPWSKELYRKMNPFYHLYKKSASRLETALASAPQSQETAFLTEFCEKFTERVRALFSQPTVPLSQLPLLIQDLDQLEGKWKKPLLFHFENPFSPDFIDLLLSFHAFLYHLRSLIALHYNDFIDDSTQESLPLDPLTDYLPSPEFIVNDALILWQFRRLSLPYSQEIGPMKPQVPQSVNRLLVEPMERLFRKHNHNAYYLLENLPQSLLAHQTPQSLEETLYFLSMDWLLGSPCGLLFKIREELYGIQEGYENVFWSDHELLKSYDSQKIHLLCSLNTFDANQLAA